MKTLFTIAFPLLFTSLCGQTFQFSYSTSGLGSNRGKPSELSINIKDSVFNYIVYERTSKFKIDPRFKDTVWEKEHNSYDTKIGKSTIDSIVHLLQGKEGKYVFVSNPSVMSGSMKIMNFEYSGSCVLYILKNTYDSTAMKIINLLNKYLPFKTQIYLWREGIPKILIKNCTNEMSKNYVEILMDEYELIRQKEN